MVHNPWPNTAENAGGGITTHGGLAIYRSLLANNAVNAVGAFGGGIATTLGSTMVIVNSTFSSNSAPLDGHRSHGDSALQVIATVFDLLAPVELLPNVTYWLALTARTDRFGVSNNSQWAEAGNGAAGGTYLDQAGTGWIPVAGDRAFQLDGAGSGVPDGGSSLLLLVLAMVPLAKLRRLKAGVPF